MPDKIILRGNELEDYLIEVRKKNHVLRETSNAFLSACSDFGHGQREQDMFVRDCGAPAAGIRSHAGKDGSRTDRDPIRQPVDMPGETGQAGLFSKKKKERQSN